MNVQLTVVVPAYNEEGMLVPMAERLVPWLDLVVGPGGWQILVVDNGSTDGTAAEIAEMNERWHACEAIFLENPDVGAAFRAGLLNAAGEWAHIINVDFWDGVFFAWSWLKRDQYQLLLGSKRADLSIDRRSRYRRILTWGLNVVLRHSFGSVCTDTHGPKLLHLPSMRQLIKETELSRGQFDTEFTLRAFRAGLRTVEAPIPMEETRPPRNLMLTKIVRNLYDVARLHRVMKAVPVTGPIRYHRWARDDMVEEVAKHYGVRGGVVIEPDQLAAHS